MAMSPAGLGTKNDCAGEDQQQFTRQAASRESAVTNLESWVALLEATTKQRLVKT
jgi:hypothetical protein